MVRYLPDLAARAAAWLALPLQEKRGAAGLAELGALWAAIQGLPAAPGCRQCQYSDRAREVAAYLREYQQLPLPSTSAAMSETQTPSKYQIAPQFAGQTFVHEDHGKAVTADNYTDEDAEFFRSKGRTDAFVERGASAEAPAIPAAPAKPEDPTKIAAEKDAHKATKEALKSEKDAHKETKKELAESQKQLATAQKELAKLADAAKDAADKTGGEASDADAK